MNNALPVFSPVEETRVKRLLALRVAQMMGRKLEEDDWSSVYCSAKGIPSQTWSNLNIDVMHGHLGVEHKMLCYRSKPSLLAASGTSLMHPAATRSLRTGDLNGDPDVEMARIFDQYSQLLQTRREEVARRGGVEAAEVDLRTGWLIWQESLREFLYFEEATVAPSADQHYAEWVEKKDGRRKGSRNLWIYERATGKKRYSLTTTAGVKLQPYFDVPGAKDPNLYHWTVIGEVIDSGDIRLWLTERTAAALQQRVGELDRETVSQFVLEVAATIPADAASPMQEDDADAVTAIVMSDEAYSAVTELLPSTNDDHLVQLLLGAGI